MLHRASRLTAFLCALFWFSCGSGTAPASPQAAAPPVQPKAATVPAPDPRAEEHRAEIEHGAELYAKVCAVCHGANGEGYKADRAPALAHQDFLASTNHWFLKNSIAYGRAGTTMSAWAKEHGGPLSSADTDAISAFIRSWLKQPRAVLDERPLRGDYKRAEPVYARECAECHGAKGIGGPNIQIGDPKLLASVSNGFLRYAISKGRSGTPMPAFADKLGPEGLEDMVTLLRKFGEPPADPKAAKLHGLEPPRITAPLPLGKVPLNPQGPDPVGFEVYPKTTSADVIHKELTRGARMALLDARAPSDYVRLHIAGAVSVPFYDPTPYLEKLPKNAWLVSYCSCPHAESGELAQKLLDHGFKKVTVLAEGLGYWESKKWKTKTGEKP